MVLAELGASPATPFPQFLRKQRLPLMSFLMRSAMRRAIGSPLQMPSRMLFRSYRQQRPMHFPWRMLRPTRSPTRSVTEPLRLTWSPTQSRWCLPQHRMRCPWPMQQVMQPVPSVKPCRTKLATEHRLIMCCQLVWIPSAPRSLECRIV